MKNILNVVVVVSVMLLVGCGDDYTVKDFIKDKELRVTYLKKCKNGEINQDGKTCLNVHTADRAVKYHEEDKYL